MFNRIRRHLLFPSVILMISLYLIGLRFWQNREYTEYSSYNASESMSTAVPEEKSSEENTTVSGEIKKINLNTASAEDLQSIKGIGPKIAQRIILHRDDIGKYTTIEQLMQVEGIGEKFFANIKDYVTVD